MNDLSLYRRRRFGNAYGIAPGLLNPGSSIASTLANEFGEAIDPLHRSSLLALARISGETAPLLFTAFGNPFWSLDMTGPVASVPVTMNAFANIADERLNGLAWAAAFCMTMFVLALGLIARSLLLRNRMSHD